MKHINTNVNNNNTNVNNNNNNNNNNDGTYDGKIRNEISDIRVLLSRLGNIVTKNEREKIKKSFIKQKIRKTFQINLLELVNKLNKKGKYRYHDRDDLDYHGIRNTENVFDNIDDNDYYKQILINSSFDENYKFYETKDNKDKKLSIEQYLDMIKPY